MIRYADNDGKQIAHSETEIIFLLIFFFEFFSRKRIVFDPWTQCVDSRKSSCKFILIFSFFSSRLCWRSEGIACFVFAGEFKICCSNWFHSIDLSEVKLIAKQGENNYIKM